MTDTRNLELFFNKNRIKQANKFYAVTESLPDENGNPLKWEFKKVDVALAKEIRKECFIEKTVKGKMEMDFDSDLFTKKIITESCIYPPLNNKDLQDSYGVKTPEDLVMAMVDGIGEWSALEAFVMELNGLNTSLGDKVEEAKN